MSQQNDQSKTILQWKKGLRPSLQPLIWNTIICSGPLLNLTILLYQIIVSYQLKKELEKVMDEEPEAKELETSVLNESEKLGQES